LERLGWFLGLFGVGIGLYGVFVGTGGSGGGSMLVIGGLLLGGLVVSLFGISVAMTSREHRGAGQMAERSRETDDDSATRPER
jgi:hypothetical protein